MKKKFLNKQLVKAIAVGISASMALQPVTVFAGNEDSNVPDPSGEDVIEKVENTPLDSVKNAEKDFADSINKEQNGLAIII